MELKFWQWKQGYSAAVVSIFKIEDFHFIPPQGFELSLFCRVLKKQSAEELMIQQLNFMSAFDRTKPPEEVSISYVPIFQIFMLSSNSICCRQH